MKKIYVFRHGQTTANVEKNRDVNPQLTELGRAQALILGDLLKNKNIEYLYSSYLDRARDTAKMVGSVIGIAEVEMFGGLEEIDQGSLKNTPKSFKGDLLLNYKDLINDVALDMVYPAGEGKLQSRERIFDALLRIARQSVFSAIGVGSHGFVMRELLGKLSPENYVPLKNCEVIELDYDEQTDKLIFIKRISDEAFTDNIR